MIRRWKHFTAKEKLIFLLLFAILLPTVFLLAGQYIALSELRDKSRAAFENSLRQNFVEIENKTENRLLEKADAVLKNFPENSVDSWNSDDIKTNLDQVLEKNADADTAFVYANADDIFKLAEQSREKGFREAKALRNPSEAVRAMGGEDFLLPLVSAMQSSNRQRSSGRYFIGQQHCENCAADNQPADFFYLYRIFSEIGNFTQVRGIGVRINKDALIKDHLSPVINSVAESGAAKIDSQVIFGVFNERRQLIYTNAANAETLESFEIKSSFGRSFPLWTLAGSFRDNKIEDLSNLYFRRGLTVTILILSLLVLGVLLFLRVAGREVALAKAKSAFVSNVSHELKTPLALIRLFAETLQSGRVKTPEKAQEYYRIISNETRRLTMLIDNILDFSAIEAGRKNYNFAPCDLSEVVAEVVQNYSYSLENSGFEIESNFAANLPPLSVDCDAVSQAVLNLLNNAAKYSADEKFIRVSVERRSGNIVIEITDHGIGIAPDEQPKIFDDFYRVGGSNDVHNVKGSGLGLSLVKHIVEAHGGQVSVNSVLHRGSTFTISLPIISPNGKKL